MMERLKSVIPTGTKQMNLADVSSSGGCHSMLYKFQCKAPQNLEYIDQGYVGDAAQTCSHFSFLCHSRETLRPFGLSCSDF